MSARRIAGRSTCRRDLVQEAFKLVALKSVGKPVLQMFCTQSIVEANRMNIPIEYHPFHASAVPARRFGNTGTKQLQADFPVSKVRKNENILEVQRRACEEGGVCFKNDRVADSYVLDESK